MKNKTDSKAPQLLREYFELPASRELPLDLPLSNIEDAFAAINFTFFLEEKLGFELDELTAEKIILGNIKRYLKLFKGLENGR